MKQTTSLKKNYEFKRLLSKGKYSSGKYVVVFYFKNKTVENKLGVVVSKKIACAAKRNRIRRLIKENYRLIEEKLNIGYKMIIMWKKTAEIKDANSENLKKDILFIFEKEKFIKR